MGSRSIKMLREDSKDALIKKIKRVFDSTFTHINDVTKKEEAYNTYFNLPPINEFIAWSKQHDIGTNGKALDFDFHMYTVPPFDKYGSSLGVSEINWQDSRWTNLIYTFIGLSEVGGKSVSVFQAITKLFDESEPDLISELMKHVEDIVDKKFKENDIKDLTATLNALPQELEAVHSYVNDFDNQESSILLLEKELERIDRNNTKINQLLEKVQIDQFTEDFIFVYFFALIYELILWKTRAVVEARIKDWQNEDFDKDNPTTYHDPLDTTAYKHLKEKIIDNSLSDMKGHVNALLAVYSHPKKDSIWAPGLKRTLSKDNYNGFINDDILQRFNTNMSKNYTYDYTELSGKDLELSNDKSWYPGKNSVLFFYDKPDYNPVDNQSYVEVQRSPDIGVPHLVEDYWHLNLKQFDDLFKQYNFKLKSRDHTYKKVNGVDEMVLSPQSIQDLEDEWFKWSSRWIFVKRYSLIWHFRHLYQCISLLHKVSEQGINFNDPDDVKVPDVLK